MSRRIKNFSSSAVLLLPILLILCFNSGGIVHAEGQPQAIDPFEGVAEATSLVWEGVTCAERKVKSVSPPSLVKVNGDVFAVAKVECTKENGDASEGVTGIAAMLLPEGNDDVAQISMTDSGNVYVHALKDNTEGPEKKTVENITAPTTIVGGGHIYMLLGTPSQATSSQPLDSPQNDWGLLLVKGEVEEIEGTKKIRWSNPSKVKHETRATSLTQLAGGGGSGIVMQKDKTLAFPMQATKNGKTVFLVMYWSESDKKWKLSTEKERDGDCSDPAIVEWGEGNSFTVITPCAKGSYDVYRSTELGNGWKDTGVPLTRVWGTSRDRSGSGVRSGFITTTIEKRKVLLVTLPVYSEDGKGQLHLFLTDNAHVYDVGPVSLEGDNAAASNLLYTNDNRLVVVYEKKNSDASTATSLVSVHLTEQLEQIKSVVQTWDEVDKSLKECTSDERKPCSGGVPTEGLVGFLSDTHTDSEWKDEYLCVNATVKGTVTKTETGLKFEGTGAGAEWPVGKLGQNQPYYFANNQFTLVATVTIHEEPTADSTYPLIGVKMNDTANTVLFGLSYSHDNKWVLVFNNTAAGDGDEETWEKGKKYQVALSMRGSEWSVYVDGNQINEDAEEEEEEHKLDSLFTSHRISHFYIGGYGDGTNGAAASSSVTVTNVLLYNKELFADGLNKLRNIKVIPSVENAGQKGDTSESTQETVQGTEEEEPSPEASPALDKPSPNAPEETLEKKGQDGGSAESQGAKQLPPLNGEVGAKQAASDTTTKAEESQGQHEESPPSPITDSDKDNERLGEVNEVEGGTLRKETDDETTPQQTLPLGENKEGADDKEEKPSSATDKEGTIVVKDAGHTNPNETTPSGLDNHDNASSRGSDEASTSGENDVSNTATPQRSTDERNEGTLESIETAPGAHREGDANRIAASSPSNNTSVDSKNVTDLVARLTNNDSAARESLTRGLLLLSLGLCTVLSLC